MASLLARVGLTRPELRAWAMYDWANSAFQTTIITAVFPPFFATFAAAGLPPAVATTRFAWATTIAVAITAVIRNATFNRFTITQPQRTRLLTCASISSAALTTRELAS